jgi:23S rRNA (guanosine2251-2'-O)-methyltransferase
METFTIFGIRAILEALNSEKPIDKVWLLKGTKSKLFEQLLYKLREKNIAFSFVPVERLSRFSEKNHQGAVARIGAVETVEMEPLIERIMEANQNPLFLLLDGITDVRNFGAILRSAAASGIDAVFIPSSGSAPLNGDTIKTSAGGAFKVPISKVNHLKDVLFYLKSQEVSILALTEKASQTIYQQDLKGPTALIFGSEDIGISSGVLKLADVKAKLPIENEIDSLNVSVACGIVFYEAIRQRL